MHRPAAGDAGEALAIREADAGSPGWQARANARKPIRRADIESGDPKRVARRIAAALLLVAAGTGLVLPGRGANAGKPHGRAAVPVRFGVGCMGRVEPGSRIRHLAASSESGGVAVLEQLAVGEGDRVERDQLLGWFADHAIRAAELRQAEAEQQRTEAHLLQVHAGAKTGDVSAAEARVARQRAAEENARAELRRVEKLAATKLVAPTDLESRQAAWTIAAADLRAAEQEHASIAEVRRVDVAVAEAEVATSRAAAERARAELALAELRAPIAGTVLKIHTWPGEKVDERGVLDLGSLDEMHVVAEVYETDVGRLRVGQRAAIVVPGEAERFSGEIVSLGLLVRKRDVLNTDPVDEIDSRVVEVRVRLDPEGARQLARRSFLRVQVIFEG